MGNGKAITMEMVYDKLEHVERKLTEIEYVILPEVELSAKEKKTFQQSEGKCTLGKQPP